MFFSFSFFLNSFDKSYLIMFIFLINCPSSNNKYFCSCSAVNPVNLLNVLNKHSLQNNLLSERLFQHSILGKQLRN